MHNKYLLLLALILCTLGCSDDEHVSLPDVMDAETRAITPLLPLPAQASMSGESFALRGGFNLVTQGVTDRLVTQAYDRLTQWTKAQGVPTNAAEQWTLTIDVAAEAPSPVRVDTDESYTLRVKEKDVRISAKTGIGALRAISTLKQLISGKKGLKSVMEASIIDTPRYPWRGIMMDVARHHISLETLRENIDAMETAKMNVLHLHLSDNQAFRLETTSLPKLHTNNPDGKYYSKDDMKELIEYAALRGVRIVPEFNLPGHASPWVVAYPEMALSKKNEMRTTYGVFPDAVDPTNQGMYIEVAKFIKEMTEVFPDQYYHIGADEVLLAEWEKNDGIKKFIKDQSLRGVDDVRTYFCLRMVDILKRAGKKTIVWDDALRRELSKAGVIVQAARSNSAVYESVLLGSPAIKSSGWYLDHRLSLGDLYSADPLDAPDYMNLKPDSTNWTAYELSSAGGLESNGVLFTFGEGDDLNGLVRLNNRNNIFKSVERDGDRLKFRYESASGPVIGECRIEGNDLAGILALSVAQMPVVGKKIGGHDMKDGILLPDFTVPEMPTPYQLDQVLGGEACAWTEWADDQSLSHMVWPQALAVAEKLWSPANYTSDSDDLYRRVMNSELTNSSELTQHQVQYVASATRDKQQSVALLELLSLLEPVKYYNRWVFSPQHDMNSPLNGLADIVATESLSAHTFSTMVDDYVNDANAENEKKLFAALTRWSSWYEKIYPKIEKNEQLDGVIQHMSALAKLSRLAIARQQGVQLTDAGITRAQEVINNEVKPHAGVELSIANDLMRLINEKVNTAPVQ